YDALGRRTGRTTPTGAVSSWTYDAAGRRTSLNFPHEQAALKCVFPAHGPAGLALSGGIARHDRHVNRPERLRRHRRRPALSSPPVTPLPELHRSFDRPRFRDQANTTVLRPVLIHGHPTLIQPCSSPFLRMRLSAASQSSRVNPRASDN
ncbi:RHS repeat domain-containing protein, partial [Streptomyces sp. NPDC006283]|uniref:RHS repeat domain-containing protein n=1 Tax=Streptomyces sp. NPDC006283 TaxID=3156741 RepID=UPI0033ADC40D